VGYQVSGLCEAKEIPAWQTFSIGKIYWINLLPNNFTPGREGFRLEDTKFSRVFAKT
jgi:hypothetical protein